MSGLPSNQQRKSKITVKYHQRLAQYFREHLSDKVSMQMMLILGGEFIMGAPKTELDSKDNEKPQHRVSVPTFFMGKYSVTQEQWQTIMGNNPSNFKEDKRPVESVSWNDAQKFCIRLSKKTSRKYRLPSEAEWEYACRAGTTTAFHFGETITTDLANYRGTNMEYKGKVHPGNYGRGKKGIYRKETTSVGEFPPNNFGLCDMHGNVWEWCQDYWYDNYQDAPNDSSSQTYINNSSFRVVRGGSWVSNPVFCRSATRLNDVPEDKYSYIGFRVVCEMSSVINEQ